MRSTGSGNIGATNVARTLGVKFGVLTLFLDMGKGLIPVLAAGWLFEPTDQMGDLANNGFLPAAAGLAAFLGHIYSPFLKFKGGKGVATALGVYLALSPLAIVPALVVFLLVVAKWGYVSAGSLSAALVVPFMSFLLKSPPFYTGLTLVMAAFIFITHRENLGRLLRGRENKWRQVKN